MTVVRRQPIRFSASASTALSSTPAIITVGAVTSVYANAQELVDWTQLGLAILDLDTIAGGATTITWYLAQDSSGDIPITPSVTDDIVTGATTATDGSVTGRLDVPYVTDGGNIYVVASTDTGTCNATARVFWTI